MDAERRFEKEGEAADGEGGNSGAGLLNDVFFSLHDINIKNNIVKNCIYLYFLLVVLLGRSKLGGGHSRHSFRRRHLYFDVLSAKNLDEIVFIITWDHLYFLVLQYL